MQKDKQFELCFMCLVGKPDIQELLLAPVGEGRLQVICSLIRLSQPQANL